MDEVTRGAEDVGGESKRCKIHCPAKGCIFTGTRTQLEVHWRYMHDSQVVLFQCPLPRCRMRVREEQLWEGHWRKSHHLSSVQIQQLAALPPLAELKGNHHFRNPGPVTVPVGPLGLPSRSPGSPRCKPRWRSSWVAP